MTLFGLVWVIFTNFYEFLLLADVSVENNTETDSMAWSGGKGLDFGAEGSWFESKSYSERYFYIYILFLLII